MSRRGAILLGLAGTLAAAGARAPVIRQWPASLIQAAPCTVASEVPSVQTAMHVAAGLAALRRGGWRRPAGIAGAVANAAAVAALADLRRDADRSADVLAAALAPLGAGAGRAADGSAGGARRTPAGPCARRRYRHAVDVAYGPDPAHRLDVWGRRDVVASGAGAAPVLLQVHGGAWSSGDKGNQAQPLMAHLAENGWICVTVNYRLGPGERWPSMIVDVKRAIAWIRTHVAEYGGDPDFVAITGGSAGGHLAALAALTPNDPEFQPGFADVDTSVAAAVPLYGVHDFSVDEEGLFALLEGKVFTSTLAEDERTWLQASPVHRAGPDAPPFLVIHGSTDTIAGVGQSRRLVTRLREVSHRPVCYAELPHAQHGFDAFPTARTGHTVRAVHGFLGLLHERYRGGRVAGAIRNGHALRGTAVNGRVVAGLPPGGPADPERAPASGD
ncbi:alpha/beta hydrolase [Pseudonocardia acidicola]|uniref:Alpha/beta hydrolase n=1 Tax=Pseudonocardia acidicola TaxID=2724939 RepID=A0ABX1SMY0_9PSEU|nr:alpha/beta hydrolase [Pseudonocardia acidicola]NMI01630.1 alpha/beta hydrolase [Pseudonocardia acidicola]